MEREQEKNIVYIIMLSLFMIVIGLLLITTLPFTIESLGKTFQDTKCEICIVVEYYYHILLIIILESMIILLYKLIKKIRKKDSNYEIKQLKTRIIKLEEKIHTNNRNKPLNHSIPTTIMSPTFSYKILKGIGKNDRFLEVPKHYSVQNTDDSKTEVWYNPLEIKCFSCKSWCYALIPNPKPCFECNECGSVFEVDFCKNLDVINKKIMLNHKKDSKLTIDNPKYDDLG